MTLFILSAMWGATLAVIAFAVLSRSNRRAALERLDEAMGQVVDLDTFGSDEAPEEEPSLFARVIHPGLRWVAARSQRFARPGAETRLLLRAAGHPLRLNVVEFVGLKVVAGAAFAALAVLALIVLPALRPGSVLFVGAGALLGFTAPSVVMNRLAARRRFEMQLALPDFLDLVILSVEAGMGFDGAVARAISNSSGPLAEELAHVLAEVSQGRPRLDAFRELAERAKVEEISLLVSTVHQAEQLGVSIGTALRELAGQLREERLHRAREIIAKLPVKMLFPLMVFIFPALFIVILGPAAIMLKDVRLPGAP